MAVGVRGRGLWLRWRNQTGRPGRRGWLTSPLMGSPAGGNSRWLYTVPSYDTRARPFITRRRSKPADSTSGWRSSLATRAKIMPSGRSPCSNTPPIRPSLPGHGRLATDRSGQPGQGAEFSQPRASWRRSGFQNAYSLRRSREPRAACAGMRNSAHPHVGTFREAIPTSTQKARSASSSVPSGGMDIQARPMGRPVPMNAGMAPLWSNSS